MPTVPGSIWPTYACANCCASAKSNAHLQRALYTIADLSYADIDVPEMLAGVHAVVARLTYAENFFVACARMR